MKLVIDNSIPFVNGVFEPYAEVSYKVGWDICRDDIADADGMMIRTRTKCTRDLLEGTPVRIIATTSIGTDHIDTAWCSANGIACHNASGCNSGGVMNYVFSALYGCAARKGIPLADATFGIVGLGNVGRKVEYMARALGFKVLRCDPPRAASEPGELFCDLDTLLASSDIVSLHIPLDETTRGIANAGFFAKMKDGAFFINTSRGELVVEDDLIAAIPRLGPVVIDTWDGEPFINTRLMDMIDIATPHIAGYSLQGKQIGSAMAVRNMARFFGISERENYIPAQGQTEGEARRVELRGKPQGEIASIIQYNYPIFTDDFIFRMNPDNFIGIRRDYMYRTEFFI